MPKLPEEYGQVFRDDYLDISQDVISFADLIVQDKHRTGFRSNVYSISARFGIGKTFFCDKLNQILKKKKIPSSIFNVWKSDFYEDPLIPILSELNKLYKTDNPTLPELPTDVLNHRSWWKIIGSGIKFNGKCDIPGIAELSLEIDGEKMVNEHTRQVSIKEQSEKNAITIFEEYNCYEAALENLKKSLEKWVEELEKPVVIIIDELDRCRPDYAIKTLEVIKHLFDISGLVFVLAIDEEQLENSVKCLYGTKDFDGYKRKFINNSFRMRDPDNLKFVTMLYDKSNIEDFIKIHRANKTEILIPNITEKFIKDDQNRYIILTPLLERPLVGSPTWEIPGSKDVITKYFSLFSNIRMFNFSLRKQEQVFDRIVLFTKSLSENDWFSPDLVVLLACIHEYDKDVFNKFRERIATNINPYKQLIDVLDSVMPKEELVSSTSSRWKRAWESISCSVKDISYKIRDLSDNPEGSDQVLKRSDRTHIIDKVILFFNTTNNDERMKLLGYKDFDTKKILENYFSKIEFMSRFSDKNTIEYSSNS